MKIPSAESIRRSRSADVGHLADLDTVDEEHPGLLGAPKRAPLASMSSGSPFSPLEDILGGDADRFGKLGVQPQALEVAVEGHHIAGLARGSSSA